MLKRTIAVLILGVAVAASGATNLNYPQTKKVDQKDNYHGTVVEDPYRWLETDVRESKDVQDWVQAENKVSFGYLESLPYRGAIEKKLTEMWNYERYSPVSGTAAIPEKYGDRYFFAKNSGLQNQSVLYTAKSLSEQPRVLLDPNTWSKDGTVALSEISVSEDGRYLAYAVAEAGSDWTTWHVLDVDSGKVLADEIKWVKFSNTSWSKDGKGFYYSRYPEPESGDAFQSLNTNMKLYYHRLGEAQSEDTLIYERPDQPEWNFGGVVTEDGKYLVIETTHGTDPRNQVQYLALDQKDAKPVYIIDNFDSEFSFAGNNGPLFYFKTSDKAPRCRVIAIDINHPEKQNWKEIIPQSADMLRDVNWVGKTLVAEYLKDARSEVRIYNAADGKFIRNVDLGTIGTASGFGGRQSDSETFFNFSSYTVPPSVYRYDVATGKKELVFRANVKIDPNEYEVKQVFYKSKDGTKVPMFLSYRKGLKLDGTNPTLLYGYGGFDIPMTPTFSVSRVVWMQMGGVLAVANLRGGGEYGEEWHKAGTKLHKQNVFDDFISAGEWLIAQKYTSKSKLAIQGGSNGGLLVGAVLAQRPDLFGAALPAVGVMDMLRFQKFTAGRFWTDDYGSSDNPDEFKALYAYSPYHNLKPAKYPATLVTTADHDDRVVPGHSFKFAARLQEMQQGGAPVIIRIETRAGHGAGKPVSKQIEETADSWSFLAKNLGMTLPSNFGS